MKYPKVNHRLPELFDEIIKYDNIKDRFYSRKIISIVSHRKLKQARKLLLNSATNFIKRQRTGNAA
jgi:hypothetical protein